MIKFPQDFLWGAATSAYQVEGNNINSDWWEWEKRAALKEASGDACRHYRLYESDFDLAKALNHNAHRLSIEWSRIEPEEGRFLDEEISHYIDVILSLKRRSIEPVVTLHHFSNPLWLARLGGWENKKAVCYFLRFIEQVLPRLAEHVRYWVTINEPLVYVYHAFLLGYWPPQKTSLLSAKFVEDNLAGGHIRAYRLIHGIYRKKNLPSPYVSIAKNTQAFVPCIPTLRNKIAVYLRDRYYNFNFVDRLIRAKTLDFIGINYYSRSLVETRNWGIRSMGVDTCNSNHSALRKNSLGWDIYPEGLYGLLLKLKRYNLPIMITENGICTGDDNLRWDYIREHLINIYRAYEKGAPVFGYLYWSLLDNYEWDKGFGPRFGLIEVDYNTYNRTIRESAVKFAEVCKTGILE